MLGNIIRRYSIPGQICAVFLILIGVEITTSGVFWDKSMPDPKHAGSVDAENIFGDDLDHMESIIENRPVFDPTRRLPPASLPVEDKAVPDFTGRYAGAVIGPEDRVAFFVDAGDEATTARVGDLVQGWKVLTIDPDFVMISGPSGEKRLEPSYAEGGGVPVKPGRKPPGKRPPVTVARGQQQATVPPQSSSQMPRPGVVPPSNGRQ